MENDGITVIDITPEVLSNQKIEQLKVSSINKDETYLLSWKYVLLVQIMLEIYSKRAVLPKQSKSLKLIRKFLVANAELEKNIVEWIFNKFGLFSSMSVTAFGGGVSLAVRQQDVQRDTSAELEKIHLQVETLLRDLKDTKIFILIDRVDEVWHQTAESEMMVIGLIKAIHAINSTLYNTHAVLFLRSDIYNVLKFNDADKFHSLEERIGWEEEDLMNLIANRGRVSMELSIIGRSHELWNSIFAPTIHGMPSFQYILKRTFKRPRDFIQFCNNALTEAQNKNHRFIYMSDILEAEKQYSFWKLRDIANEFLIQYPYLEELLALFQGFKNEFTRDEFETRYQEAQKRLVKYPDLQMVSADKMLQILFITGFLGTRKGNDDLFVYDESSIALAQQELIIVHPMFHLALGLPNVPQRDIEPQRDTEPQRVIEPQRDIEPQRNVEPQSKMSGANNIVGDVTIGGGVTQHFYEPETTTRREWMVLYTQLQQITDRQQESLREINFPLILPEVTDLLDKLEAVNILIRGINNPYKTSKKDLRVLQKDLQMLVDQHQALISDIVAVVKIIDKTERLINQLEDDEDNLQTIIKRMQLLVRPFE